MMHDASFAWLALLMLGGLHGINPGMGWLFAVSLGLQEQDGRAVWRALGPLALGHALAIGATLLMAVALGMVLPLWVVKWIAAVALLAFGILHLVRHRHPRGGGMRVGARQLTLWSFFMASAHGAGLMALPFALRLAEPQGHGAHAHAMAAGMGNHSHHLALAALPGIDSAGVMATLVHTAGYLAVAGIVALVVYHRLGLRLLRTAWINLDLLWAGALIVTALLVPLV